MKIRSGDTVKVLYGKDSGKTGKVLKVLSKKEMVLVEGVNLFKKHLKGDGKKRQSEIITIVKPLPISKVQLVDPGSQKATRVGYKLENGKKARVGKRTGKSIATDSTAVKVPPVGEKSDTKTSSKKKSSSKTETNKSTTKVKAKKTEGKK